MLRPVVVPLIALCIGIFAGYYFELHLQVVFWCVLGGLSLTLLSLNYHWKRLFVPGIIVAFLAIGIGSIAIQKLKNKTVIPNTANRCMIVSKVLPLTSKGTKRYILKNPYGANILCYTSPDFQRDLFMGDTLFSHIKTDSIPLTKNPYTFDYRSYLSKQNINYQVFINNTTPIHIASGNHNLLKLQFYNAKKYLMDALEQSGLKPATIALAHGLLLGDRSQLSENTKKAFSDTGVFHILAISGLHIGILLILLNTILYPLIFVKTGKFIRLILIVTVLWAYAFFVGMPPSVTRAVIMFSCYRIAKHIYRNTDQTNILLTTCFLTLLINPLALLNIGFHMSYTAMLSICVLYPLIEKHIPKGIIFRKVYSMMALSISVQIFMTPLLLYYFHQFSGLFLMSNLIIVALLPLLMVVGLVSVTFIGLDTPVIFFNQAFDFLVTWMNVIIYKIAEHQSFVFRNIYFDEKLFVLAIACVMAIYFVIKKQTFMRFVVLFITIISMQLSYFFDLQNIVDEREFIVFSEKRHTILGIREGRHLHIFTNDTLKPKFLDGYITDKMIENITVQELKNAMVISGLGEVLIVNNSAEYHKLELDFTPEILLISGRMKVNPERILKSAIKPNMVLCDSSTPKHIRTLWQRSCSREGVTFYDIDKRGAYRQYLTKF